MITILLNIASCLALNNYAIVPIGPMDEQTKLFYWYRELVERKAFRTGLNSIDD